MSNQNGGEPQTLPTATIKERVNEYLFPDKDACTMIFEDPAGGKFQLMMGINVAVVINKMCERLVQQYHHAKPDKGIFFHQEPEASVFSSEGMRGHLGIQFSGGISRIIDVPTALALADLLKVQALPMLTESQRMAYNQRVAPLLVTPRHSIIKP